MKTYRVVIKLLLVVIYLRLKFLYANLVHSKTSETVFVDDSDDKNSQYQRYQVFVATQIAPYGVDFAHNVIFFCKDNFFNSLKQIYAGHFYLN